METFDFITTIIIAVIPGVVIALFTQWLDIRHRNLLEDQERRNGRTLLGLEIESNRTALAAFWQEINNLDEEQSEEKKTSKHLTAMVEKGFLSYPLPHWNYVRWNHAQPSWLAALEGKEVVQIDQFYRDLQLIEDLYSRTVTLTPEEQEYFKNNRFWTNRYGEMRDLLFDRLAVVVKRALSATDVLKG